MAIQIRVTGPEGHTAILTPEQLNAARVTIESLLNGKLSVAVANATILQKLEDVGLPVIFGGNGDAHQAGI